MWRTRLRFCELQVPHMEYAFRHTYLLLSQDTNCPAVSAQIYRPNLAYKSHTSHILLAEEYINRPIY